MVSSFLFGGHVQGAPAVRSGPPLRPQAPPEPQLPAGQTRRCSMRTGLRTCGRGAGDGCGLLGWSVEFGWAWKPAGTQRPPAPRFCCSGTAAGTVSTKPTGPTANDFPGATRPIRGFILQLHYLIWVKTIVAVNKIITIIVMTKITELSKPQTVDRPGRLLIPDEQGGRDRYATVSRLLRTRQRGENKGAGNELVSPAGPVLPQPGPASFTAEADSAPAAAS